MEIRHEMQLRRGKSYFGSGCYRAGFEVIEGEIEATPIAGSEKDNGFVATKDYLVQPKGGPATIRAWDGDAISSSGHRSLGPEGLYLLVPDDGSKPPRTCPQCGHILEG